jgi:nicotinate-nucleotide--dimethylbenzimidazole phosphoribosyltransferase
LPFDDIRRMVADLPGPDADAAGRGARPRCRSDQPPGASARLEEIAVWLAAWQGRAKPAFTRPLVAIFASNHGVAARGVSAFPQAVTRQMVENFAAGGAAINQLCIAYDLGLKVFELALDQPTPDIVVADAFDEKGCRCDDRLRDGGDRRRHRPAVPGRDGDRQYDGVRRRCSMLSTAGKPPPGWAEAPAWMTPAEAEGRGRRRFVARIGPERDPLEVLRRVGGREIAALVGAILAARTERVPASSTAL